MVSTAIYFTCYFVVASQWDIARKWMWVVLPLVFIFNGLWAIRHLVNNIRLSLFLDAKENQTSSYGGEEEQQNNNIEDEEAEPGTRKPQSAVRSVSPFNSHRKHRKLRGIKRKPLEVMTAVSERTAEGTVLFTHVDGLEGADDVDRNSSTRHESSGLGVVVENTVE